MQKYLVLGKDGQVGRALQRALAPMGEIVALGRAEADLTRPEALRQLVRDLAPTAIINAAAYTAVDKAETDSALAATINAEAVEVLAEEAARRGAWFVHYSTDYVFDGTKDGAYVESDPTNPLSIYAKTKLAGERAAAKWAPDRHLIFRTSWVYGALGRNFLKTILRLAAERDELRIVADQIGAPTDADLVADVTALALYRIGLEQKADLDVTRLAGLYHLTTKGEVSWHGFAKLIVEEARAKGAVLKADQILPIPTTEYPAPAKRPLNSRLDCRKIEQAFDLALPDWQVQARRVVAELFAGD